MRGLSSPDEITQRAERLVTELAAAVHAGHPAEWLEEEILSALHETALHERERCAALAEERAQMWRGTKLNDPAWPPSGRAEAQARHKEAFAIADAIRAGFPQPPLV